MPKPICNSWTLHAIFALTLTKSYNGADVFFPQIDLVGYKEAPHNPMVFATREAAVKRLREILAATASSPTGAVVSPCSETFSARSGEGEAPAKRCGPDAMLFVAPVTLETMGWSGDPRPVPCDDFFA